MGDNNQGKNAKQRQKKRKLLVINKKIDCLPIGTMIALRLAVAQPVFVEQGEAPRYM